MQPPGLRRKGQAFALLTAGLLVFPLLCAAQTAPRRTLVENAKATVRDVAATAWHSAQDLSVFALGLLGVDYRYGGTSPETGLDCSGLVLYVFQQVTGVTLPRTAKALSRVGDKVAQEELQPGDLVFFNTRRFAFSHVGIYLGDNRFIHAPSRGREVEIATFDKRFWQKRFNGARRLIGVVPELVPSFITQAQAAPFEVDTASIESRPAGFDSAPIDSAAASFGFEATPIGFEAAPIESESAPIEFEAAPGESRAAVKDQPGP